MVLETTFLCLAMNVFQEARGEDPYGQCAVAHVTINRAGGDLNKVCEVVTKPRQFSWTVGKRKHKGRIVVAAPKDKKAWERAKRVAFLTMKGHVRDFTDGATFYHADYVNPYWNRKMKLTVRLGAHKFYKQP